MEERIGQSNYLETISIIIPVYNICKIKRCFKKAIESVMKQTYKKIEIIFVNDGSTDDTEKILLKLKKKDTRIKVFSKKNGGVESARRYGIEHCTGEFIFHMDQDDILVKNAIEKLYLDAETNKSDVVIGNSARFIGSKWIRKKSYCESMSEPKIITHQKFMDSYYHSFFGINDIPVQIWGKLYRKDFLDNIPNPPRTGLINEDLMYNMHVLPYAEKISVISDVIYLYRWGGIPANLIQQY